MKSQRLVAICLLAAAGLVLTIWSNVLYYQELGRALRGEPIGLISWAETLAGVAFVILIFALGLSLEKKPQAARKNSGAATGGSS